MDEQLGGQEFEALLETEIGQGASIKLKELEIRSRELELQVKQTELEIEQHKNKTGQNSRESSAFDPSRVSRLVPPFKEDEIDQYFVHFEKIALNLKWPKIVGLHYCKLCSQVRHVKPTITCLKSIVMIMKKSNKLCSRSMNSYQKPIDLNFALAKLMRMKVMWSSCALKRDCSISG